MSKGTFKRVGTMIVPAGRQGQDALFALPENKVFMGEFRTTRNPELHELFWTLCQLVADATDTTKDGVKEWLLMRTGFSHPLFYPDGTMEIRADSIAWESMEEATFRQFFDAAVPRISELLRSQPQDVIDRFNDLLDPEARARFRRLRRKRQMGVLSHVG